jgi:pilus assembly protein Flp/PilA
MMNQINRFVSDDSGAETVEYALVLALLAVAAVVAIGTVGTSVSNLFTQVNGSI